MLNFFMAKKPDSKALLYSRFKRFKSISIFAAMNICFLVLVIQANDSINNIVGHKDAQLNLYLDFIRYNTQEKLGILPYILQKGSGVFLEVGTGGDPIADLLAQIPEDLSPLIIASDIDSNILEMLPIRHPRLNRYLEHGSHKGARLKLQQLDATDMACFKDNYLDGINASAIVHEIVSYAGGLKGIDKFFTESFRTLKPNGVLVYRDPEGVSDKQEMVVTELLSRSMRLFAHIFIPKFLDTTRGILAQSGRKTMCYTTKDISFVVYKKNEITQSHLSYEEYLETQSSVIDFSRKYIVKMPRGLCRELERHYLTYLHQCNPLSYVKCLPNVSSNAYYVNFLAHSTHEIFHQFLASNSLQPLQDASIDISSKTKLDFTILENTQALEYGIALKITSRQKQALIWKLLKQYNFDPYMYIICINSTTWLLDYRVFGLLYDHIIEIIDENVDLANKSEAIHAQWLKREGEENYIYYSDDELITRVAELTYDVETDYILCPVSIDSNSFVPRLCYEEVLRNSMALFDLQGYPVEIKEGKRIIHFSKILLRDAIPIFSGIVAQDSHKYSNLKKFVKKISLKDLLEVNHE